MVAASRSLSGILFAGALACFPDAVLGEPAVIASERWDFVRPDFSAPPDRLVLPSVIVRHAEAAWKGTNETEYEHGFCIWWYEEKKTVGVGAVEKSKANSFEVNCPYEVLHTHPTFNEFKAQPFPSLGDVIAFLHKGDVSGFGLMRHEHGLTAMVWSAKRSRRVPGTTVTTFPLSLCPLLVAAEEGLQAKAKCLAMFLARYGILLYSGGPNGHLTRVDGESVRWANIGALFDVSYWKDEFAYDKTVPFRWSRDGTVPKSVVALIQASLALHGAYDGDLTGVIDERTKSALSAVGSRWRTWEYDPAQPGLPARVAAKLLADRLRTEVAYDDIAINAHLFPQSSLFSRHDKADRSVKNITTVFQDVKSGKTSAIRGPSAWQEAEGEVVVLKKMRNGTFEFYDLDVKPAKKTVLEYRDDVVVRAELDRPDGTHYIGPIGNMDEGPGVLTGPTWRYEGQFKAGEMNGHGVLRWIDGPSAGAVLDGTWRNGKCVSGTLRLPDGRSLVAHPIGESICRP